MNRVFNLMSRKWRIVKKIKLGVLGNNQVIKLNYANIK